MMMKTKLTYLLLATFAAASLSVGCQKQSEQYKPQPIRFKTFLKEGKDIRPLEFKTRTIDASLDAGFYLRGVSHMAKLAASEASAQIGLTNGKNIFNPNQPLFWLQDKATYYSFQACVNPSVAGDEANSQYSYSQFSSNPDPSIQGEMLGAEISDIQSSEEAPTVNLYFEHLLSRVVFKIRRMFDGPALYDVELKIRYVDNAIKGTGSIYWAPSYSSTHVPFNLTAPLSGGPYSLNVKQTISPIETTDLYAGDMILIPQPLQSNWLEVQMLYSITPGGTGKTIKTLLSSVTLKAGEQINFIIGYIVENDVPKLIVNSVSLENWDTIDAGIINEYL